MGGRGRSAAYVARRGQIVRRYTSARHINFVRHLQHDYTLLSQREVDSTNFDSPTPENEHEQTNPCLKERAYARTLARMHTRTLALGREGHSRMRRWVRRHSGRESS